MKFGRMTAGLLGLLLLAAPVLAQAQAIQLTAAASGSTVQLTWSAVDGAILYGIEVAINGVPTVPLTPVGAGTSLTIPGVPPGAYAVRITANTGAQSNIAVVSVAAAPAVTPAPTNLAATINGNAVLLSWGLPSTSGLAAMALQVMAGGAVTAQFPIPVGTSFSAPSLPNGIYTVRVVGWGPAGGFSTPSNEITLNLPGCTAPAGIPLTAATYGTYLSLSWPPIPGAAGYRLDAAATAGGAATPVATFGPTQTSVATFVPIGTYYLTLHSQLTCGAPITSGERAVVVDGSAGSGPRRPSGSVSRGQLTGEVAAAANAVAAQYPGDLFNSCREHGGNNRWLFRLVQRLRTIDSRYGLNWKRGNFGDMSQDVVAYNYSDLPDDQARAPHMLAWDVIAGHCGSPSPWAADISNPNGQAGWTLLPFLQAGFTP